MPWENFKVENQRLKVVQGYFTKESSLSDICKQFGISRKTAYKWINRFLESGEEGLRDLPKAPLNPNICYTKDQIDIAINLKLSRPTWGPKKILEKLKRSHPNIEWPSPTWLYEIFKDHHLVTRKRIKNRVPATSPLGILEGPNDTWTVDLKGWFITRDGQKCEPLTLMDCYSRYLIRCTHLSRHTVEDVWSLFDKAFREYGLPNRMRSDNGSPFGSCGAGRLTKLSIYLIKAGVVPEWIQPGHPEQNGRHERFHSTLKQEVACPPKDTLALQALAMLDFQKQYNFERPHEALNMQTPASKYQHSARSWDGKLRSPEYDTSKFEVRKVEKGGQISWKGFHIFVSESLYGEYIGLQKGESNNLEFYYGPIYLGKLDKHQRLEKPKMQTRRQR